MRRTGKKLMTCLLAAVLAATAVTGCGSSGAALEQEKGNQANQESQVNQGNQANQENQTGQENHANQEGSGTENGEGGRDSRNSPVPGSGEGGQENVNQKVSARGKSLEAKEPKKADISPEDYQGWNKLLKEQEVSEEFRKGLEQFAWKSGSQVLKETQGNGNFSPLSLYYTLALAGCGAQGETAAQILENLGVKDQKELADQCRRLYQWYVYQAQRDQEQMARYGMEDYKSTICLGNSLWISNQLPVYEDYQKLAAEQFFASSYGVDFGDPDTGKEMGDWIARKTSGVLAPQLNMDPSTLLAILNTLYFYGGWAEPFLEENTQEDVFTLEDGSQVTVPYLNRTEMTGAFRKGEGYTLSWLGTNNNCRMVFLLPDEGKTVGEFLDSPEKLEAALDGKEDAWIQGKVVWKVPKFDFGSSYRLESALAAMGMDRMFGGNAEFGGISPEALQVSSVIQETHIGVDENGVEGAAYTMMALARGGILDNGETAEMILNRPFLFGIQDVTHDTWLFLGVCRNPEGEGSGSQDGTSGTQNVTADKNRAKADLLLTEAPEICLEDALSSTMESFPVKAGNYTWNWEEDGRGVGVVACKNHPLQINLEKAKTLKIPHYNRIEEVSYVVRTAVMPETLTVREWDISQAGQTETAEPLETVYQDPGIISLKRDKIYEFVGKWPEEQWEKCGFYGEASYVVVTE